MRGLCPSRAPLWWPVSPSWWPSQATGAWHLSLQQVKLSGCMLLLARKACGGQEKTELLYALPSSRTLKVPLVKSFLWWDRQRNIQIQCVSDSPLLPKEGEEQVPLWQAGSITNTTDDRSGFYHATKVIVFCPGCIAGRLLAGGKPKSFPHSNSWSENLGLIARRGCLFSSKNEAKHNS